MARKSNRDIERHYFEMFRKDFPLPDGLIVHSDKPDVIVDGKRRIGIEITNFFLENGGLLKSEQIQRKAREEVVLKAQEIYLSNSGKRIELSFSFDKASPIRNKEQIAKKIAALARDIDRRKTGSMSKEIFKEIPELSYVYLNANEYADARWRIVQGHSVPVISIEKLQKIVSIKEEKAKHYQHCDAYWLLVVVDFWDPAQDQEIQTAAVKEMRYSFFEKVIVYKPDFGQVIEAK